jgi:hypothetical protein
MRKAIPAATATITSPTTSAPLLGTGAKLIARINAATSSTDRTPPRLSTGSLGSLTWAGTNASAISSATTASGKVTRSTEPHQNDSSSQPDSSGPSEAMAPPVPDHNAIDRVRPGLDHNAVISASVVG